MGNKLKFWTTENNLIKIKNSFRQKMTDQEVAKNIIGISKATFYRWMKTNKKFRDAVEAGKAPVTDQVIASLEKLCFGFYVEEGKIDESGHKVITKRYIPPNITAIIFYLKNRDREHWRDKWIENYDISVVTKNKLAPIVIKDDLEDQGDSGFDDKRRDQ